LGVVVDRVEPVVVELVEVRRLEDPHVHGRVAEEVLRIRSGSYWRYSSIDHCSSSGVNPVWYS
jgi:hypothetical protein